MIVVLSLRQQVKSDGDGCHPKSPGGLRKLMSFQDRIVKVVGG